MKKETTFINQAHLRKCEQTDFKKVSRLLQGGIGKRGGIPQAPIEMSADRSNRVSELQNTEVGF